MQAAGVGGKVLRIIHCFLLDTVQSVKVDGKCSSPVDVVSGVLQGNVLASLLFFLSTGDLLSQRTPCGLC